MRFSALIEGLQILAKYETQGLESHINGADHDVIWAATADVDDFEELLDEWGDPVLVDRRLSAEDNARLVELGWFISEEYAEAWTCFC